MFVGSGNFWKISQIVVFFLVVAGSGDCWNISQLVILFNSFVGPDNFWSTSYTRPILLFSPDLAIVGRSPDLALFFYCFPDLAIVGRSPTVVLFVNCLLGRTTLVDLAAYSYTFILSDRAIVGRPPTPFLCFLFVCQSCQLLGCLHRSHIILLFVGSGNCWNIKHIALFFNFCRIGQLLDDLPA